MLQANLAAANSVIAIQISGYLNGAASIAISPNAQSNIVVDMQVYGTVRNGTPEWITIGTFDPINRVTQAHMSGPGATGWADVPGYTGVRAIRTDANGGDGLVSIEFREH